MREYRDVGIRDAREHLLHRFAVGKQQLQLRDEPGHIDEGAAEPLAGIIVAYADAQVALAYAGRPGQIDPARLLFLQQMRDQREIDFFVVCALLADIQGGEVDLQIVTAEVHDGVAALMM